MSEMNNIIYKKICLEHFKSRVPGLLSSIDGSENEINKGNWGKIPFDLNLNKIDGFGKLKEILSNFRYANYTDVTKDGITKCEEDTNILRLRFRNLMLWYHWIINLFEKKTIYSYSENNAIIEEEPQGLWVEETDYNIFDKDTQGKTLLVTKINHSEWDKEKIYVIVTEDEKEYFENHGGFEVINLVEDLTGRLQVPADVEGSLVPKMVYYSEIEDMYNFIQSLGESNDCCLLQKYEDMGGDNMIKFLYNHSEDFERETEKYKDLTLIPYTEIPLSIIGNTEDMGVMFNGEQEWIEGNKYSVGDIVSYDNKTYVCEKENTGTYDEETDEILFNLNDWESYFDNQTGEKTITSTAVSQLQSFRINRLCYSDNGMKLEGMLDYEVVNDELKLVLDDNGYTELLVPFEKDLVFNFENGYGDYIKNIEYPEPNVVRFTYVIGGKIDEDGIPTGNGGIQYTEAYIFSEQETREYIDNKPVKIKYKQINYDLNVDNGSMFPILSTVSYRSEDVFNEESAIKSPVFRKDYLFGLSEYPTENVNITIDRGIANAFEKHLMLCETNTFNDLKNYKNNYFNLQ